MTATTMALPARHLVLKPPQKNILRRDVQSASSGGGGSSDGDPKLVARGDMQLYAFHEPALVGGTYTITTDLTVQVPTTVHVKDATGKDIGQTTYQTVNLHDTPGWPTTQKFVVVAPQFAIDPKDIHSVYPPQGHADQPSVLPHIVFNDSHLPWERELANTSSNSGQDRMPWLAVLPFDCNGLETVPELRLTDAQLNGVGNDRSGAVYTPASWKSPYTGKQIAQTSYFSVAMTVAEYLKLGASNSQVHIPPFATQDKEFSDYKDDTTPIQVIFLNSTLFSQLFVRNSTVDLSQYQFCAHVRNINTEGMTSAGVEDTGLFSIVHALRTGPTDVAAGKAPRSQTVHVVTLEYLDQVSIPGEGEFVALVSLYQWTYLCQPPLSVNFVDSMRAIGEQVDSQSCMLRCTDDTLNSLGDTPTPDPQKAMSSDSDLANLRKYMHARFSAGYTLVRHRMASGETSVAMVRSPLAPETLTRKIQTAASWPLASNNGQDYQIFDKYLGIMDITYSTAWQLGKTMATSDMAWVAALMRIRTDSHKSGAAGADLALVNHSRNEKLVTKQQVFQNLTSHASTLKDLADVHVPTTTPGLHGRWSQVKSVNNSSRIPARSPEHPVWQAAYAAGVKARLEVLASANGSDQPTTDTTPPTSSDWAFIQSWVMDKLFLDAIPFHYLIADPTHLPPESIRFFHIDNIWMDCFLDGALSVANHLARDDDLVRQGIKQMLNIYLKFPSGGHVPQVPIYGFFLRSAVVQIFPDLRIDVPFPAGVADNGRKPVLLQRNVRDDTVMCLLDRLPDNGEIQSIRLSQPPHQQRFSAGDFLDGQTMEFMFRKVYPDNTGEDDVLEEFGGPRSWSRPAPPVTSTTAAGSGNNPVSTAKVKTTTEITTPGAGQVYDWDTRCLDFDTLALNLFNSKDSQGNITANNMGTAWEMKLNSAMVGLELNDTLKYLEFKPAKKTVTSSTGLKPPRQIYIGETDSTDTKNKLKTNIKLKQATTEPNTGIPSAVAVVPLVPQTLPKFTPRAPNKFAARSQAALPTHLNKLTTLKPPNSTATTVSPAATTPPQQPGPGMKPLQFDYAVYPSTTPFNKALLGRGFITTSLPYAPDIIFSVNLRPTGSIIPNLMLHEIQFRIPIRARSLRTNPRTDIMNSDGLVPDGNASVGSGARMLSNQRWIVHLDHQQAYLVLRLIPRTMRMTVPITENQTLSFRLNEVEVAGPDGSLDAEGVVAIAVTETYGAWQDDAHTKWADMGSATTMLVVQRTKKTSWP